MPAADSAPVGFRFLLHSRECDRLGVFSTPAPNWEGGEMFTLGDGRRFRVVTIVPLILERSVFDVMFMVEPIEAGVGQR